MQVAGSCEALQQGNATPKWITNGRTPVLVGGHFAFIISYFLGLYTIFHVARAYKKLELKVRLLALLLQYEQHFTTECRRLYACS